MVEMVALLHHLLDTLEEQVRLDRMHLLAVVVVLVLKIINLQVALVVAQVEEEKHSLVEQA
jgi:hypothetical protein